MSVPYMAIVVLSFLMLFFVICRFVMTIVEKSPACEVGCCKTIGSREVQEDFFRVEYSPEGMLAVLADGMGRELGGRIAARTVTEVFAELFGEYNALDHPFYFFQKAFQTANREVLKILDEGRGSAAASAVMLKDGDRPEDDLLLYYAIVGNVKVAVFRDDELIPVGTGHTLNVLAEDKYYSGDLTREDALVLLDAKRVYNYIGRDDFKEIEFYDTPIRLKKDDIVVLMSDGIYEGMEWKELEEVLGQRIPCQQMALRIVEHINHKSGDKDNACIVLIRAGDQV